MIGGLLSLGDSSASLPALWLTQVWLSLGWSLVAATGTGWLLQRWRGDRVLSLLSAVLVAVWVAWPGVWGGHHWLGLAFQAPSVVLVMLSTAWVAQHLSGRVAAVLRRSDVGFFAGLGVVAGWVLLLDTLGVFSLSVYQWGFGTIAPAVALCFLALPWALSKKSQHAGWAWIGSGAVVFFVALQLPTGNLWDALIDPWLWLVLHIVLLQRWRRRT